MGPTPLSFERIVVDGGKSAYASVLFRSPSRFSYIAGLALAASAAPPSAAFASTTRAIAALRLALMLMLRLLLDVTIDVSGSREILHYCTSRTRQTNIPYCMPRHIHPTVSHFLSFVLSLKHSTRPRRTYCTCGRAQNRMPPLMSYAIPADGLM